MIFDQTIEVKAWTEELALKPDRKRSLVAGIATAMAIVVAIGMPRADDSPGLTAGEWVAEDIDGRGVIDNARTALAIDAEGKVSGSGGCNRMRGTAAITGQAVTFGPLATTKKMCPEALMDQERRFLAALEATRSWRIEGPLLGLYDENGKELVRFTQSD